MAKVYYAYIYTHPVSYDHLYVGKGTRDRAMCHLAPRGSQNGKLRKAVSDLKKLGMKPIVTKIETSTEEFAFMLEQGLIKKFGRQDLGTGTLCNFSDGGDGPTNIVRSEEAKRKTSESLREFYRHNEHIMTPEAKAKMIATKRANPTGTGKWINNGTVQTKCKLVDLEEKLNNGWKLGCLKKHLTKEYSEKMSAATKAYWNKVKATGHTGLLIKIEGAIS